ncbi:MAG: hypothetical protein GX801_00590 [Fibrobacter sp.]|nr:hypothetical protein [Fibrobacter sp.]
MKNKLFILLALILAGTFVTSCSDAPPPEIHDYDDCSENSRFKDDC